MALSFRTKLLASHVGLVALVVAIAVVGLNQAAGADLRGRLDQRLEEQARGAAAWVGSGRHRERLASRLAAVVHARVTIIDASGEVIGDSDYPGETDPAVQNQATAPEVVAARSAGVGRATRASERTGEEMQLVAVTADDGLVIRLGVPLSEVQSTLVAMRVRLLVASLLALVVAVGLGGLLARVIARPLRRMTESATRIAQGDYDIAVGTTSPDDFGILSRTLASLAAELKERIGDLTAERDRLSAILTGMVEGVLVVGRDGRVVVANPSAARIVGAPGAAEQAELAGKPLEEAVPHAGVRAVIEEALASGEVVETEIEALAINVRPLAAAARGGVVAVLHDLARVRRLETMRKDFLANLSHELRTPVTAIQGYAETLLRGTADAATQREFLETVHRHSARIGRLVEDLLRLSSIEARKPGERAPEPIRVAALCDQVGATVRARAEAAGLTLAIEADGEPIAFGDPDGLEQVLENLVDNAIKYGRREGGSIRIAARTAAGRVRLSVADDGPGIAAAHLPRIFERFYRVDPGRARDRGGTGLGLSIARHLVESMGGEIAVESAVGEGTRFTVELPAAQAAPGPGATCGVCRID